jgi:hypothetical protein
MEGTFAARQVPATALLQSSSLQPGRVANALRPFGNQVSTPNIQGETVLRAAREDDEPAFQIDFEKEERIAKLEAMASRGKVKPKMPSSLGEIPASAREIPSAQAEWRAGSLVPEGWEQMTFARRARELWTGKYGALFWLNTAATALCIVLVVAWVVFRFIGPALGLYTLEKGIPGMDSPAEVSSLISSEEYSGPAFDMPPPIEE